MCVCVCVSVSVCVYEIRTWGKLQSRRMEHLLLEVPKLYQANTRVYDELTHTLTIKGEIGPPPPHTSAIVYKSKARAIHTGDYTYNINTNKHTHTHTRTYTHTPAVRWSANIHQ